MNHTDVMKALLASAIIPAVRTSTPEFAMKAVTAIAAGGVRTLELPMTVPFACDVIRHIAKEQPELIVGAGTVLDVSTARMAILAGAQFIVSPSLNVNVIACCKRYGVPVLPGALTPTEIVAAWQAGADFVKVFPVSAMGGASYIKALLAPLPQVRLMPMGGVNTETASLYLQAGAVLLGVGADLVDNAALARGATEAITAKAQMYVETVRRSRHTIDSN
jgi:2-dehydro-3-deoxyphosphogluconate aldolase / (4S)-4-hydroxy-2-oxoglutarate aldolase